VSPCARGERRRLQACRRRTRAPQRRRATPPCAADPATGRSPPYGRSAPKAATRGPPVGWSPSGAMGDAIGATRPLARRAPGAGSPASAPEYRSPRRSGRRRYGSRCSCKGTGAELNGISAELPSCFWFRCEAEASVEEVRSHEAAGSS
jgi:hypothetical protein